MKNWTVLIFLAADNNLNSFAERNIHQMERYGSTDNVDVVVQLDRYGTGTRGTALRGQVTSDPNWREYGMGYSSKLTDIGETNTGDPDVLRDFIEWGVEKFPAQKYALIIWNHGSGWKPEFIYKVAEEVAEARFVDAMRAVKFADQFSDKLSRVLFRRTAERIITDFIESSVLPLTNPGIHSSISNILLATNADSKVNQISNDFASDIELQNLIIRAIGLDESSAGDALDAIELKSALELASKNIANRTGKPFVFEVLGFDACLMAGLEVAYQIKDFCKFSVGSEEIEPGVGWHYDLILGSLNKKLGGLEGKEFAEDIVTAYLNGLENYKIRLVTLSAVASENLDALVNSLNSLGVNISDMIGPSYGIIARSEKTATRFFDTDYLDIGDFLQRMRMMNPSPLLIEVEQALAQAVILSGYLFSTGQSPTGLSVYFPTKPKFDKKYATLDVAGHLADWVIAIRKYHFLD